MEIIEELGSRIMRSENIPYLRVDLQGLLQIDAYQAALENPRLWTVIADHHVTSIVLNHSPLWKFSTEYYFYLQNTWVPRAAGTTLTKASVIVPERERVWEMFSNMLTPMTSGGFELRFFPDSQFYETAESVAWL